MTPTGDERREVAERLRKCGAELSILGADCETAFHVIDKVVGCREEDSWERFLGRLADLIDPTCHNASPQAWGTFECSECGAQTWYQSIETRPRFCPHCGARLVERSEG